MLLSEISKAINVQLSSSECIDDVSISRVSTDTRTLETGDLFVALRGPSFNGHSYLNEAINKGCVAAIVDEKNSALEIPQLVVKDTRIALGLMAEAWRMQFDNLNVFAITGSCGKTTVKEMLAAILSEVAPTLATYGNLNNDIGVPLTLLRLNASHRFAVVELGANAMGEIAYTAKLVHPDVAIITNAAAVHVEGFGSISNVAREKGEIYKCLNEKGVAIVNGDDLNSDSWLKQIKKTGSSLLICSKDIHPANNSRHANYWLENVCLTESNAYSYDICSDSNRIHISSALLGFHNVINGLLVTAAAKSLGVANDAIQIGLNKVKPASGRLNTISENAFDVLLIDDTYNASPHSVNAAIDLLSTYPNEKILILGDMGELGEKADEYHFQVGLKAKEKGVHQVLAVGQYARDVIAGFGKQGVSFEKQEELINALADYLKTGMVVLVKGSRSAYMENVVNAIKESAA